MHSLLEEIIPGSSTCKRPAPFPWDPRIDHHCRLAAASQVFGKPPPPWAFRTQNHIHRRPITVADQSGSYEKAGLGTLKEKGQGTSLALDYVIEPKSQVR
jgi:hypothetical protein